VNVLSDEDRMVLRELLWEEMPEHLLRYLSVTGTCRRSQLVSEAIRRLPSGPSNEMERAQVKDARNGVEDARNGVVRMLSWLEARGDVCRIPQGRYRCTPPHTVGVVTDSSVDHIPLFGDPAVERDVEAVLKCFGGRLQKQLVVEEDESETEGAQKAHQPVGIDRVLCLPAKHRSELEKKLEKIGLTVLSPDHWLAHLPTIWELSLPGSQAFFPPPKSLSSFLCKVQII
jgi:hypothetical protein